MGLRNLAALALAAALILPTPALAHCDGLDGPVVTAARKAFEFGDPNFVLIWVQPKDEAEVRRAFTEAVAVRKLGARAREMADQYFFETLVRLHRTSEGAPYTGLKPAGRDLGPAIQLADRAVSSGSESELATFVMNEVERGIREKFEIVQRKRNFRPDDLASGREFVASYVSVVHYVERLLQATEAGATGHYQEKPASMVHHE